MSKTNSFETDYLNLIFKNIALANIGDASGIQPSGAAGSLFVALYTSDPGEAGGGSEATYGGYARQAVTRGAGWTVAGNQASNTAAVTYPECTSGSETITHVAVFTASSGGDMLYHGVLDASVAVATGVTLEFAIGTIQFNED